MLIYNFVCASITFDLFAIVVLCILNVFVSICLGLLPEYLPLSCNLCILCGFSCFELEAEIGIDSFFIGCTLFSRTIDMYLISGLTFTKIRLRHC